MAQRQIKLFEGGSDIEAEINEWMSAQPDTTLIYQPEITAAHGSMGVVLVALVMYQEQASQAPETGLPPEAP